MHITNFPWALASELEFSAECANLLVVSGNKALAKALVEERLAQCWLRISREDSRSADG